MTEEKLPPAELLASADDGDSLRSVAEVVLQLLMETEPMAEFMPTMIDVRPPQITPAVE